MSYLQLFLSYYSFAYMSRILGLFVVISLFVFQDATILNSFSNISPAFTEIASYTYYVCFIILAYGPLAYAMLTYNSQRHPRSSFFNLMAGTAFSFLSAKFIWFVAVLIIALTNAIIGLFAVEHSVTEVLYLIVLAVAYLIAFTMLYGVIYGKYKYQVEEVPIYSDRIPEGLDGLRIVQISDIHSGTWDSVLEVQKGIKLINEQQADLILFTGDLVNRHKDEIDPYIEAFASLIAPYGKYAVLGNHDYVGVPRDVNLRQAYWDDLLSKFDKMGFRLLLNEHVLIDAGAESLALIGVENWGDGRFFPKRGDLDIAMTGLEGEPFTLLMSHDPSHWQYKVLGYDRRIDLTLSGHTHGMQFGIKIGSFQWSPVKFRYPYWMGLYNEKGRQLYVNRGFGLLAFPGRVGMYPEITVLTLKRGIKDN